MNIPAINIDSSAISSNINNKSNNNLYKRKTYLTKNSPKRNGLI